MLLEYMCKRYDFVKLSVKNEWFVRAPPADSQGGVTMQEGTI
jgi:hypothetical protein